MAKIFRWTFRIVVILCSFLLSICILPNWVNTTTWILPSFVGLGFLVLFLATFLLFLYLLFGWSKWAWIPFIALVLNFSNLKNSVGTNLGGTPVFKGTKVFKVLSLNTHLFNYFKEPKTQAVYKSLLKDIKKQNASVVCLQEFLSYRNHTAQKVQKELGFEYAYFKKLKDGRKVGDFGMLILSKFAITDSGFVHFNPYSGNIGAWVTLDVYDKKMNLFSVHLQSIGLGKKDFSNLKNPEWQNSKGTFKRIRDASIKRAEQVHLLKKQLATMKDPVILLGDFNAPPVSYTYLQLSKGMTDAFVSNSFGIEQTYNGKIPGMRIDYFLSSPEIKSLAYESFNVNSDHKMLISRMALP